MSATSINATCLVKTWPTSGSYYRKLTFWCQFAYPQLVLHNTFDIHSDLSDVWSLVLTVGVIRTQVKIKPHLCYSMFFVIALYFLHRTSNQLFKNLNPHLDQYFACTTAFVSVLYILCTAVTIFSIEGKNMAAIIWKCFSRLHK